MLKPRMKLTACGGCGRQVERLWDMGSPEFSLTCEECGEELEVMERLEAPMVMEASCPDGTFRGEAFHKAKMANRLKRDLYNQPMEKRGELAKEIHKLEKVDK